MKGLNERISARVVELREAKGWSQSELARRADFPSQRIWGLEAGKQQWLPHHLERVAEALGVAPGALLPAAGAVAEAPAVDPRERRLLEAHRKGDARAIIDMGLAEAERQARQGAEAATVEQIAYVLARAFDDGEISDEGWRGMREAFVEMVAERWEEKGDVERFMDESREKAERDLAVRFYDEVERFRRDFAAERLRQATRKSRPSDD